MVMKPGYCMCDIIFHIWRELHSLVLQCGSEVTVDEIQIENFQNVFSLYNSMCLYFNTIFGCRPIESEAITQEGGSFAKSLTAVL